MTLIADAPAVPEAPDAVPPTRRIGLQRRARRPVQRPAMANAITRRRDRVIVYVVLGVLGVLWAFPM